MELFEVIIKGQETFFRGYFWEHLFVQSYHNVLLEIDCEKLSFSNEITIS